MPTTSGPSGTPRARSLGAAMRTAREARKVSLRAVAKQVGYSHVTVGTWERGDAIPADVQIATYLGALGVTGEEREEIMSLATNASDPNWLLPGMNEHLAAVLEYERSAVEIFAWTPLLVPGLLQTSDYARIVLTPGRSSAAEVESALLMRLGRAEILTRRTNPTRGVYVIGEAALRHTLGGPQIMANQAEQLIELSHRENLTIRVLPFGREWHPGLNGQFVLYRFAEQSPIVYVENLRSAAFPYETGDLETYIAAADTLLALALSADDSRQMLAELAERETR